MPNDPAGSSQSNAASGDAKSADAPMRSVHTANFPELLRQLNVSIAVSTYQAGKLVMLRAGQRGPLNTHFRTFARPMGVAAAGGRLAIGAAAEIWEFHDVPAVCRKLDERDEKYTIAGEHRHDACYLPRVVRASGDVRIHEMVWAGPAADELWFVNTRFSCLCTAGDSRYSFVPRWRPSFITHLAPEDRCHLNGLGLRDGVPRYVTALAATNVPQGWRDHKRDGGLVIDVKTGSVLCTGLSMPHSPRWHDGRLWVLQSGDGTLGYVDLARGMYEPVVSLPGFTRGLDFRGRFAFVGLSQIRETAVFSGIEIAERPASERHCGVWVVDLQTGQIAAFVRFEQAVQEIFAVQALPGVLWPDVLTDDNELLADSFVLPDEALTQVDPGLIQRHAGRELSDSQ